MRVTQKLKSGTIIRQDFRNAVCFVFFKTGNDDWPYATHGGTLFIVVHGCQVFGLTCRHVLQDFDWRQLVVTDQRAGSQGAGRRSIAYPSQPKGAAVDTDLLDVAVIQFSKDVGTAFFKDHPYIFEENTVSTSTAGDTLHVAGTLKSESVITETIIVPYFCLLEAVRD